MPPKKIPKQYVPKSLTAEDKKKPSTPQGFPQKPAFSPF